ncbi:MAG TPA: type 4a pilus biogenesis protein PilO [Firmicutes bacterium]|nr:type 4a pilus biogenesis protein PilO [Bacillota bacterium]
MITKPIMLKDSKSGQRTRLIIILIALYVLAVVAFTFFYAKPTMAELKRLRQSSQLQATTLASLADLQRRHATAQAQYQETLRRVNDIISLYPREADLPFILATISNLTTNNLVDLVRISYTKPEWGEGVGRMQITADLSGDYKRLAKILVQLPQILPTARLEDVRFSAVLKENVSDMSLKLMEVDHLDVHMVMTVWLMSETTVVVNSGQALPGWYPRPAKPVDLPANDPFQPAADTVQLVKGRLITEKLEQTMLTGIVVASGKTLANLQVNGRVYTVSEGDILPELEGAKINRIDTVEKRIVLDIAGERITLKLGGN